MDKCYWCSKEINRKHKKARIAIHYISYPVHWSCMKIFYNLDNYVKVFGVFVRKRENHA